MFEPLQGKMQKAEICESILWKFFWVLSYCDGIFTFHMKNVYLNERFKLSSIRSSILHIQWIKLYAWDISQIESNS